MGGKPFLKWAGGKGQLLSQFEQLYPGELLMGKIKNYVEPFLGGGAVFFDLINKYDFETVILNDITRELILTYRVIQTDVEVLIDILAGIEQEYLGCDEEQRKEYYYDMREQFNKEKETMDLSTYSDGWIMFAARFIFLNKTCYNGLYRLNSKGGFNVPAGTYKNPQICNGVNLKKVSNLLQGVKLLSVDFEQVLDLIKDLVPKETFIYLDPPFRPLPNSKSFTNYSQFEFNDDSQRRLAGWYKELDDKGYFLMLSNSDPANVNPDDLFFTKLYSGYTIHKVYANRAINSNGNGRDMINELVITNY